MKSLMDHQPISGAVIGMSRVDSYNNNAQVLLKSSEDVQTVTRYFDRQMLKEGIEKRFQKKIDKLSLAYKNRIFN